MAAPGLSTCQPWATEDDLCPPCDGSSSFPAGLIEETLQVASDLLYILSGRQFPGTCETTVRPCSQKVYARPSPDFSTIRNTLTPSCGCTAPASCGCPPPSQITLGYEPIVEISEVKIDGVVLDPSLYRVDDYRYLVRLRDPDGSYQSWPCCQDILLPDTELDTFSVTFTHGLPPPPAGVHAAAILACELAQSCSPVDGAECRLPRRVQSLTRQGVSMVLLDPMEFLRSGGLGIYEIDAFLSTYNPGGKRRNSTVINVDLLDPVRRINT